MHTSKRGLGRRIGFIGLAVVMIAFSSNSLQVFADGGATCPKRMPAQDCASLLGNWTAWIPNAECGTAAIEPTGDTPVETSADEATNAQAIIGIAKAMNVGKQGALVALMAGLAESGLRVLSNKSNVPISLKYTDGPIQGDGNDHDSVGIFQMQPNDGWSTLDSGSGALGNLAAVSQDMNPASAAEIFFGVPPGTQLTGLANPGALRKGLQQVSNWESKDPGADAQAVEISKYPDAYDKQRTRAESLLDQNWDAPEAAASALPIPFTADTSTGDEGGDNGNTSCATPVGDAAFNCSPTAVGLSAPSPLLCDAQRYAGIWYGFGGGHRGYENYTKNCPDPSHPPAHPPNIPHDSSVPHDGNPNYCAVDCSGLVSMVVDDVYHQKFDWTVADIVGDHANWKKIDNITDARPGDVVTVDTEHVEFFVSYDAGANRIHTFGSHETGKQVSTSSASRNYYNGIYRYQGPGVSVSL